MSCTPATCSLNVDGLSVMGYSAGSAAVLDDTGRVVAHQRTITLDAEIEAADAEAMVAAIADLRSQVESVQAFNVCVDNSTVAALDRNLCTADLHGQMELGDGGAPSGAGDAV